MDGDARGRGPGNRRIRRLTGVAEEETEAPLAAPARIAMVFLADGWSVAVQLGRGGREEGERMQVTGAIAFRDEVGALRRLPARADLVRREATTRLDLTLQEDGLSVMTVPLEESATLKIGERLKELVSGLGMSLSIGFAAEALFGRTQQIERITFSFASAARGRSDQGA